MGIFKKIKQQFQEHTGALPAGGTLFGLHTHDTLDRVMYDYDSINKMLYDERVQSIVSLVASMVHNSYGGIQIKPEDKFSDQELTPREREAINLAEMFLSEEYFDGLRKMFDYAWELTAHGDLFDRFIIDPELGLTVQSIPLNTVRVLEDRGQATRRGSEIQILQENFISIRKSEQSRELELLPKGEYGHLSYKNYGVWREDIEGTNTYGIYSIPPIASLQKLLKWKNKTIENDIIWKNKLLPRILHRLNMDSIVPMKYMADSQEEKVAKAQADADKLIDNFISKTKIIKPDEDLVISNAVESTMLEASSTNYQKPNETLSQINDFLGTPQGIPSGLLGGQIGASLGLEVAAVVASMRVDIISKRVAGYLGMIVRKHLRLTNASLGDDVINRLYIHVDPSLTVEKFTKVKIGLTMANLGCFTLQEIRQAVGYSALPQMDQSKLIRLEGKAHWTEGQKMNEIEQTGPVDNKNNRTPGAERNSTEGPPVRDPNVDG